MEILNSKLVPDLERYEADIYELKQRVSGLNGELKEKDRECYNLQRQLEEFRNKNLL